MWILSINYVQTHLLDWLYHPLYVRRARRIDARTAKCCWTRSGTANHRLDATNPARGDANQKGQTYLGVCVCYVSRGKGYTPHKPHPPARQPASNPGLDSFVVSCIIDIMCVDSLQTNTHATHTYYMSIRNFGVDGATEMHILCITQTSNRSDKHYRITFFVFVGNTNLKIHYQTNSESNCIILH